MSDPISKFFNDYPAKNFPDYPKFTFTQDPDWRQQGPFESLHMHLGWDQSQRDEALVEFELARWDFVVELFSHEKSLPNYQELCEDLEIYPVPEGVNQCKIELKKLHVNLVDVIQYRWDRQEGRGTRRVEKFRSRDLAKQAAEEDGKFVSADIGKIGVLRHLLG